MIELVLELWELFYCVVVDYVGCMIEDGILFEGVRVFFLCKLYC